MVFWMACRYSTFALSFAYNAGKNASEIHEMLKAALSGFLGSNMETLVDFEHSGIFPQISQVKMWR
jgi:hypothetical protein